MKFLDLNGLKHLLKFIDNRTVSVTASKCTYYQGKHIIPFITNHQIIIMDGGNVNVFDWFKGASEGGSLEIVYPAPMGGWTYCINDENTSMIYKIEKDNIGIALNRKDYLATDCSTYTRLIKLDGKLIVAAFAQNK